MFTLTLASVIMKGMGFALLVNVQKCEFKMSRNDFFGIIFA